MASCPLPAPGSCCPAPPPPPAARGPSAPPLVLSQLAFGSINAVVNSFRMVDHIFILTGGGPDNASSLLLFYIYEVAFRFWDTAYAATLTVVLLVFLMILAIGQFFLFDRKVHYR